MGKTRNQAKEEQRIGPRLIWGPNWRGQIFSKGGWGLRDLLGHKGLLSFKGALGTTRFGGV